jgi:hypothetical protein
MKDPQPRAEMYRDFAYVTRYRRQQDIYKNPSGQIISFIASSPVRARSEPHTTSKFNKVKSRFLKSNGKKLWDKWYCKTSRDLAKEIGWEDEWRLWYTFSSDWIHGDPMSLQTDCFPPMTGGELLFQCFRYYVRILSHLSKDLVLTSEQHECMELFRKEFA